jgi:hypothetical protein
LRGTCRLRPGPNSRCDVPSTEAPVDEGGFFHWAGDPEAIWPGDLPRSPVSFSNRSLVIVAIAFASASRLIVLPMRRPDQPSFALFSKLGETTLYLSVDELTPARCAIALRNIRRLNSSSCRRILNLRLRMTIGGGKSNSMS